MKKVKLISILSLILICIAVRISAHDRNHFAEHFIDIDKNVIQNAELGLIHYRKAIEAYQLEEKSKINIVHIGDSHIQADVLTHKVRTLLQQEFGNGGRGFVFPYQIAGTNGAIDIEVEWKGNWQSYKAISRNDLINFGPSGYTLTSSDTTAYIKIKSEREYNPLNFNKVRLFYHLQNSLGLDLAFASQNEWTLDQSSANSELYSFTKDQEQLQLVLGKTRPEQEQIELYGFSLEQDNRGLIYHAMGQNGLKVDSYLRSTNFENVIQNLSADLIILSFGTNDGFRTKKMCSECFERNYRLLIERVQASNPTASILLTTAPDHFVYRKYTNPNILEINNTIRSLALQYGLATWDLYAIMGGKNSIQTWKNNGMARGDFVHFTRAGYELQGELLYDALKSATQGLN